MITQGVSRVVNPLIDSNHEIIGILESAPRGYEKRGLLIKLAHWLRSRWFFSDTSLRRVCERSAIPYRFLRSSNDDGLEPWLRDKCPDVMVVSGMSQLLSAKIFKIPVKGTINLHPSFLPEYRGANPDFWQYYNQEMHPGITVHYVDEGEDTGDIICQARTHIPLGTKAPDRLDHLVGKLGVALILEALDQIELGRVSTVKQPIESPTPRARNLLDHEHESIIDWENWPVERVWHLLRGTEFWLNAIPPPSGVFRGQRWVIGSFDKSPRSSDTPGEVYRTGERRYVAACDGRIFITLDFKVRRMVVGYGRRR